MRYHKVIPDVVGMQSITADNKHVLFLDFDKTAIGKVINTCHAIQRENDLSSFYIFKSSKRNYHVVCLDKLTFGQCVDIQMKLKMRRFVLFSVMRGYWVLRNSPKGIHDKPELKLVLKRHSNKEKSLAHWKWLNVLYGIKKVSNLDNNGRLGIDAYSTEAGKMDNFVVVK